MFFPSRACPIGRAKGQIFVARIRGLARHCLSRDSHRYPGWCRVDNLRNLLEHFSHHPVRGLHDDDDDDDDDGATKQ